MGSQQHCRPVTTKLTDDVPGHPPRRGIHPGRRLVQEQQLGLSEDRQRQLQPAPLAAGKLLDSNLHAAVEPDQLDDLGGLAWPCRQAAPHVDCLTHGQLATDSAVLEHHTGTTTDRPPFADRIHS
ncbi:MAG TPA: hypothetical protein VFZ72_12965 [Jiangellaceae bacterium]